jgi:chorismate synthase
VCRAFLAQLGIDVWSHTAAVGDVTADPEAPPRSREEVETSPLRCLDAAAEERMVTAIDEARAAGDTLGGIFEVVATGVPVGLGSHVQWDRRLDGALAQAIVSINAVKGVEFGLGFQQTRLRGSAVHDVITGRENGRWHHRTNRAGGLTGGITNGEPIVVRGAVKPISTLARPLPSADLLTGEPVDVAHYERSDISVVPAAGVIGEAMVLLTLTGFVLEKTGGDSLAEVRDNLARYQARASQATATSPGAEPEAGSGGDD